MSDQQPPPYGGFSNYAQQWPAYAPMIPPNAHIRAEIGTPSGLAANTTPNYENNMAAFNANAQLAGPGGSPNPALFYPPPFPFFNQFDPSQLPPFPPMPYPAMGFPPPLLPTGSSNPPSAHPSMYPPGLQRPPTPTSKGNHVLEQADSSMEEGEVSEENGETPLIPSKNHAVRLDSELEDGEAASSRRSSGSPYNPPLSVSVDTGAIRHAMQAQKQEANGTITDTTQPQKSAAQLRLQAQGALLSLAPHNIRFNELVAEGINPVILRQLYEEVGIKVVPPTEQILVKVDSQPIKVTQPIEAFKPLAEAVKTAKADIVSTKASIPAPQSSGSSAVAPASSDKPLERKELIAQMLAAKAAKAAPSPVGSVKSAPSPPYSAPPPASKEMSAKEKSKAQTELARKRIEELKRNALRKTQLAAQLDQAAVSSPPQPQAPVIQHPLPLRPPLPELNESASLPGLIMTDSAQEPDESSAPEPQDISVDPTPLSRHLQRKRPRASDFDEAVVPPKKPFTPVSGYFTPTDRLVIAISDDESLYGDDEDENMDMESSLEEEPVSSGSATAPEPPVQPRPSITRASTSTPQVPSSQSEQGDILLKDMEIQAMRRKIAELELRRKSKLAASRTQSPRTLDDSGASSSGGQSFVVDVAVADTPTAPTPIPTPPSSCLADRPDIIDSFSDSSIRVLAAMDKEQLNSMQSKILRMKQIESGIPDLDAGISSSESRLSVCRQEAEALVADITKGREGRYQLVEELKRLSYEINGLSSGDLDELRRQAEIKNQQLPAPAPDASQSSPPTLCNVISNDSGREPEDTPGSQEHAQETCTSYQTDSAGSAMDESDDSSSDESDSSNDDEPASCPVQVDITEPVPEFSEPMDIDSSDESESVSSPSAAAKSSPGPVDQHAEHYEDGERSVRETSVVSDAYEPPEPEGDAQSEGSSYSPPPFSPAPPSPPAPVETTATSAPSIEIIQADEALTNDHQVPAQLPLPDSQVGALGTQESSASSGKRFTPYKSPLRNFKAYRYHPNYAEDVSSGHRSLTYSHNIDSMQYLCPYELAGGVCNDRSCECQHFRDMTLSDDKILVQMGAVREGETEEEKERYIVGLKEIINDMRRDKVKDFDTVAAEIAAYRRRFLKDPSRVLPL
ncbi:uncharacterized protein N7511_000669 [Penicillium nucicola]|uniref:uncharacterized protein n=1 Tax=Penicillium nucicola TaxID=1850975 RepID=UPI002544FF34|nr:uncharacterized protein N7511_000669 [Penicillium nucicola]KAJ5775658.1 hypothetical protein N7511_000669 [Penicillium nucicola]